VEVLGPLLVWVQPSEEAEAQGWASAMHPEFEREVRSYGRGERSRTDTSQLFPLRFSLAVPCVADHVAVGF
jgi:hypothetical protein